MSTKSFKEASMKKQRSKHVIIVNSPFVKPMLYRCRICKSKHKYKQAFLKHLKLHMGTPISCNLCKEEFNNRPLYEFHKCVYLITKAVHFKRKKYSCKDCSVILRYLRHYKQHLEAHKRNNCKVCDAKFTTSCHLRKHMQEVHNFKLRLTNHRCHLCGKSYVKKSTLFKHLQLHVQGENKVICLKCGVSCETSELLAQHMQSHTSFVCSKCGETFLRKQQYQIHLMRHDNYSCSVCDKTFASTQKAKEHNKTTGHYVPGVQLKLMCKICNKFFTKVFSLRRHIKQKHKNCTSKEIPENTSYTCAPCAKSFDTKQQYEGHLKTNRHQKKSVGTDQLICEQCGKHFTKKYLLKQHIKIVHEKVQEALVCNFCDYKTTNLTNYERHCDLHLTTTKNFICELCGKSFQNLAGLRDHTKYNHEQQRSFKCLECPKAFKRNSELVRHAKTHSNICPYICDVCNSTFKRTSHLKRHQLLVHKIEAKSNKVMRIHENLKETPDIPNMFDMNYFDVPVPVQNEVNLGTSIQDNGVLVENTVPSVNLNTFSNNLMPLDYVNCDLYANTDATLLPQMNLVTGNNDFQAFNIVDQLVNSYLPNCDYTEPQDYYTEDLNVSSSDLLSATEKILQGHCDTGENSLNQQIPDVYMNNYQYMQ